MTQAVPDAAPPPELLRLTFDQYGRYQMISEALQAAVPLFDSPLRLLDVGGYSQLRPTGDVLPARLFLPAHTVTVVDQPPCALPGYVQGDGRSLAFPDGAFDFVLSCDTLEHIPAPDRRAFLRELLRVARYGVLLAAPFAHPQVEAAESLVFEYIRARTGGFEQPQLNEHRTYGLPDLATLTGVLDELGLRYRSYPTGDLHAWLVMMLAKHYLLLHVPDAPADMHIALDRYYIQFYSAYERREPAYRQLVLIAHAAGQAWLSQAAAALAPTLAPAADTGIGWRALADNLFRVLAPAPASPPVPPPPAAADDVTDGGERVTHQQPTVSYYAHLSIYRFLLPFCRGGLVLDAGSGAGYGAAYLADQGAQFVWGLDTSAPAVEFSRRHFPRSNLQFATMDLEQLAGFPPQSFDAIVSSNTLEHLPHVERFFERAVHLLKSTGVLVVAVPPITSNRLRGLNIDNPYHLNIWTPARWHATLSRFFQQVELYGHGYGHLGTTPDWSLPPEQAVLDDASFVFAPMALADLAYTPEALDEPTITAIFVARLPRPEALPFSAADLAGDPSFTRSPAEAAIQLAVKQQMTQLAGHLHTTTQHAALLEQRRNEAEQYAAHLERSLAAKNQHIAHLESHIQQLEAGRILRLLGWFNRRRKQQ